MENHNFNDPAQFDRLGVTVRTSRGDEEPLLLLETGKTTGIYEGSIDLDGVNPPSLGDGRLQAGPGDELDARFEPEFNASPAKARVEFATISFIDDAGVPTVELLENGTARVRVISRDHNSNPSQVDGLMVQFRSLYAGDQENLAAGRDGAGHRASSRARSTSSFNFSGSPGNGQLETGNSQGPEYLGEQVTASYGPFSATARTIGARVVFIDGFGRETTTFPMGSRVRVRVTDPSRNTPTVRNDAFINLSACQNDQESIQLLETGFNTGVFEGEIPSAAQSVSLQRRYVAGRGVLRDPGFLLQPQRSDHDGGHGHVHGRRGAVRGRPGPAGERVPGRHAGLPAGGGPRPEQSTTQVHVTAELSGDQEPVVLSATTPGVFAGSIELRSSPSGFAPERHPRDVAGVRSAARVRDAAGGLRGPVGRRHGHGLDAELPGRGSSTPTASVTTTYAQGSRVYVRLENHNFNDPAQFDRLGVTVRTSRGDEEPLLLLETGKTTGIYEGSLDLDGVNPPSLGDGRLQAGPGDELDARFEPEFNASPAKARVEFATITFIDEAGVPTVELLENGTARVRVISPDHNSNPGQADGLLVQLRSFYAGDQEDLPLTETGPDTGVFEGSIRLSFNFSAVQGNGELETATTRIRSTSVSR